MIAARKGRVDVEAVIHRINGDAGTVPVGMSKGEHIFRYLSTGLDRVDRIVEETTKFQHNQAGVIGGLGSHLTELTQYPEPTSTMPGQPWTDRAPTVGNNREAPGGASDPGSRDRRAPAPVRPFATSQTAELAVSAPTRSPPPGADSQDSDPISQNSPPNPAADTVERLGRSPWTAADTANAIATDRDAETYSGGRAAWPASAGKAPGTVGAVLYQGIGRAAVPPARQRAGTGAADRAHKPSPEEFVVYVFADGRRQEVSPMVARVLDAAFGNRSGTDALVAYAGSRTAVSVDDSVGIRCEPHSVVTGDIAVWGQRNAVLVVFESGRIPRMK